MTGIVQSSSATTAILVGLVREGLVNLKSAISLALGSNIGTCTTTLIVSLGASSAGRLTALLHLVFNLAGVIAVIPVFDGFVELVEVVSPVDRVYTCKCTYFVQLSIYLSSVAMAPAVCRHCERKTEMDVRNAIILALVQGLTEFLPCPAQDILHIFL